MQIFQVYGYFLRREDNEDEQLLVNQITAKKLISELNFDTDTHLIIDVTGIVMTKKQKADGMRPKKGISTKKE